jgi:hypothetical protein
MLLRVSILRPSSGSTYCSLLKLHVKIVNTSLTLLVMWQHNMCMCMRFFQCRGVCRLAKNKDFSSMKRRYFIVYVSDCQRSPPS